MESHVKELGYAGYTTTIAFHVENLNAREIDAIVASNELAGADLDTIEKAFWRARARVKIERPDKL
jgi:hypothetical protein